MWDSGLPVTCVLRLKVLGGGVEEPYEVRGLGYPWVTTQKFVTVLLQELEAED